MNWKRISKLVALMLFAIGASCIYVWLGEQKQAALVAQNLALSRNHPPAPMHHPPTENDILALVETDSAAFCHPKDKSADGCQFNAFVMDNQWLVSASPCLVDAITCAVAPDSTHFFIYSLNGRFLREERPTP